ncbi:unnamed protein product [Mytilus edulis]|uniref:Uncharacterized protein n=1 Tax=Mytilus edulis TaxID=6550 RepID=A0A8S3Q3F6_MYTED|nr:unnamed protein product [Mytilus edulis]
MYYITEIDSNTVAVSCGYNTILIINISTRSITSTIKTSGYCCGISYNDNNLRYRYPRHYSRQRQVGLYRLDITSIYCCSLDGKVMWKFKKDEFQDLTRVTTDNEGNVYVTDERTHTVIVVSDDGKHHRELLTESDGLNRPWGIYFDKKENVLLVCNERDGNAFLFDVIKKLT